MEQNFGSSEIKKSLTWGFDQSLLWIHHLQMSAKLRWVPTPPLLEHQPKIAFIKIIHNPLLFFPPKSKMVFLSLSLSLFFLTSKINWRWYDSRKSWGKVVTNLSVHHSNYCCANVHGDNKSNMDRLVAKKGLNDGDPQQNAGIEVTPPGRNRWIFNVLNQ